MLFIDRAVHRIISFAESRGWNAERYAREADIPPSTARDVLRGRGNPTRATLRKMEAVIPDRWRPPPSRAAATPAQPLATP